VSSCPDNQGKLGCRKGFLHRDVKPGNYAIGRADTNAHKVVFILDFGERHLQ